MLSGNPDQDGATAAPKSPARKTPIKANGTLQVRHQSVAGKDKADVIECASPTAVRIGKDHSRGAAGRAADAGGSEAKERSRASAMIIEE